MKHTLLLNEIFYDFYRDEGRTLLILSADTATLRVSSVGVKAAIAVDMTALHHGWRDDQV